MPSSERQHARRRALIWLLAAGAIIAGALVVLWRSQHTTPPAPPLIDPLSVVPAGPAFVLTIDIARLRTTALGRELIDKQLDRLATTKARPPNDRCESTLSAELDRLAVSVPATEPKTAIGATPTLGVIAAGRFHQDAALRCAAGGSGNLDATVRSTIGSFDTRRDPKTTREVAARDGLLIQSDGPYFRALLDRAEQRQPRPTEAEDTRDHLHAELRRVIGQSAPIVASLALPRGWLTQLLADPSAEASPLAEIRAAALRIEVTSTLALTGTLLCDRDDACTRVDRFLSALKSDLSALAPAAPSLLTKLTITRHGAALDFSGTFTPADLDQLTAAALPSASSTSASPSASPIPPPDRPSSP